mmetsp:Transcript_9291/g.14660  ORF Transcript_9291/g.14660 Transcript_9291/m.14660 type:complete len:154 (+) Transcript_9291:1332-1793(+)
MHNYGAVSPSAPKARSSPKAALLSVALTLAALAALAALALVSSAPQAVVLDEPIDDPLAHLDDSVHVWEGKHADGYDPEIQNVWATDPESFEVPFAGYADKDLHWKAPAEPEENVYDDLESGPFTEPHSMELRNLMGPDPPPPNPADNLPLDE